MLDSWLVVVEHVPAQMRPWKWFSIIWCRLQKEVCVLPTKEKFSRRKWTSSKSFGTGKVLKRSISRSHTRTHTQTSNKQTWWNLPKDLHNRANNTIYLKNQWKSYLLYTGSLHWMSINKRSRWKRRERRERLLTCTPEKKCLKKAAANSAL